MTLTGMLWICWPVRASVCVLTLHYRGSVSSDYGLQITHINFNVSLLPTGLLVDTTGQYTYIFYACSVNVATAGLFHMGSFYYLDGQRKREARSCTPPAPEHPLRPVISLSTLEVDYCQVPLQTSQRAVEPDDVNTSDVWAEWMDTALA